MIVCRGGHGERCLKSFSIAESLSALTAAADRLSEAHLQLLTLAITHQAPVHYSLFIPQLKPGQTDIAPYLLNQPKAE